MFHYNRRFPSMKANNICGLAFDESSFNARIDITEGARGGQIPSL